VNVHLLAVPIRILLLALIVACAAGGAVAPASELHRGEFAVPSRVSGNPTAVCRYAVRLQADGTVPESADNLVCVFPFPQQERFAEGGMFERLAQAGVTVFGVYFAHQGAGEVGFDDHAHCYYYPESGSADAIIAAAAKVREALQLTPRKLLLLGESGGGSAAEQFAVAHPELTDAVASTGGMRFAPAHANDCMWLLLNSRGDDLEQANDDLATALGATALRATPPPEWGRRGQAGAMFSHCPDDHARDLLVTFILGVAALRDAHDGQLPPRAQWPVATAASDPTKLLDQPGADAVRFPSREFQKAWCEVSPPPEIVTIAGAPCRIVRPAPAHPAKAIIYYLSDDEENMPRQTRYDLDYLASRGFAAVSCPRSRVGDGSAIAQAIRERGIAGAETPAYVIGIAPDAAAAAAFADQPLHGRLFFDVWPATRTSLLASLAAHDSGAPVAVVVTDDREDQSSLMAFTAAAAKSSVEVKIEHESFGLSNRDRIAAQRIEHAAAMFDAWSEQGGKGGL
jgi:hypothetical protein